jgi:hypothetical protein
MQINAVSWKLIVPRRSAVGQVLDCVLLHSLPVWKYDNLDIKLHRVCVTRDSTDLRGRHYKNA